VFRASALELHKNSMNNNNLLIGVSGIYNQDKFVNLIDKYFHAPKN
jgi:hypothetical protein